jgi:hypothetical protein
MKRTKREDRSPWKIQGEPDLTEVGTMKVNALNALIDRLRGFDQNAEIFVQTDSRSFASPVWLGIMDTAGLFDEEKDFQLVICAWEPEGHRKLEGDDPTRCKA